MRKILATLTAACAILIACSSSSDTGSCEGGCLCFTTESDCRASGCPWVDGACTNGPAPDSGKD